MVANCPIQWNKFSSSTYRIILSHSTNIKASLIVKLSSTISKLIIKANIPSHTKCSSTSRHVLFEICPCSNTISLSMSKFIMIFKYGNTSENISHIHYKCAKKISFLNASNWRKLNPPVSGYYSRESSETKQSKCYILVSIAVFSKYLHCSLKVTKSSLKVVLSMFLVKSRVKLSSHSKCLPS